MEQNIQQNQILEKLRITRIEEMTDSFYSNNSERSSMFSNVDFSINTEFRGNEESKLGNKGESDFKLNYSEELIKVTVLENLVDY